MFKIGEPAAHSSGRRTVVNLQFTPGRRMVAWLALHFFGQNNAILSTGCGILFKMLVRILNKIMCFGDEAGAPVRHVKINANKCK